MNIVSLLPSATEIICGLGLRDQLVGVTHECDYPVGVGELPRVTRTWIPHDATSLEIDALVRERLTKNTALYSLKTDVLESLQPDLIVTQNLCDVCAVAQDEVLSAAESLSNRPQVINLEPSCLQDVFDCLLQVGDAADAVDEAERYTQHLQQRVANVADRSRSIAIDQRPSVMLLEWIDPPFCAGHWSPELVELAGGRESIGVAGQRSVTTNWDRIVASDPDVMMIACCGFDVQRTLLDLPILRSHPGWQSLRCVKNNRVYVVDGSAYFSRPGPRLVDSLEILANALHPDLHPLPAGLTAAALVETT